ncbi:MAG: DUF2207 domain-containing protein [Nitrospira sp.]|nr:DUF2207 domain-containing protein [Nitrospira sp.]
MSQILSIREEDGIYTLIRDKANESVLTPEEKRISSKFLDSSKEIKLKTVNHVKIQSALSDLKNFLKMNFEKIYFITNRRYFFPGLLLSVIIMVISGFSESTEKGPIVIFLCIWLTGWSIGVTFLVFHAYRRWKDVLSGAGVGGRTYSPVWYSGPNWSTFGAGGFASSLGSSFSDAISSSSTAPGSSSGSGGGGGGGGGGW